MQEPMTAGATVIAFPAGRVKCSAGAYARHREFGWCKVLRVRGFTRRVEYERCMPDPVPDVEDLPEDVLPEEVIFSETIEIIYRPRCAQQCFGRGYRHRYPPHLCITTQKFWSLS